LRTCAHAFTSETLNFAIRSRLYAAPEMKAAIWVFAWPMKRVFRNPPTVFNQPKISSTRFRFRWLTW
jgi:hypothetical protein